MVLAADTLCALGSVALRRRADARSGVAQLAL
jgi:hypothetical protein